MRNYIRQAIVNLNLFESQRPRAASNIFREQFLTRLFILLLAISSIAAGFYTFLVVQNQVVTIPHPSLTTYQQLYNAHEDTLQCPCSQPTVVYGSFLNVTFVFHQVCSSDLVSSTWLNYLESFDPIILPEVALIGRTRDFRIAGCAYFQLLATFCSLAKNNTEDAQRLFSNTQFVNEHVLAPSIFNQQTNDMVKSYVTTMLNDFQIILNWIIMSLAASYFLTGTNTNSWVTVYSDDTVRVGSLNYPIGSGYIIATALYTCPGEFKLAASPNRLYTVGAEQIDYEIIFTELPIGCIPFIKFLSSGPSWWYNGTYLEMIRNTYSGVIRTHSPPNLKSLDESVSTRFRGQNLEYLLRQMFIELPIHNHSSFDLFYNQCAPLSCSYGVDQRRGLIVGLLLLISICGGLNNILRIMIEAFGKLIFFFVDWWKHRDVQHRKSANYFVFHLSL